MLRSYLYYISNTKSLEELWSAHTAKMAEYGFDRLIYGFTRFRTNTSLGDPEDFVILTNHSLAYTDVFLGEGLYFHAPMVRWALDHEGVGSWKMLADMIDTKTMSAAEEKSLISS